MKKVYVFLSILFTVLCGMTYGQDIAISGQVTEGGTGEGLPGVTVLVKGSSTGAVTDIDGNFNLNVPSESAVLVISSVGFISQEIVVGTVTTFDIVLETDIVGLDEVVVVGYGEQKKVNLTGAVSTVDVAKTFESKPLADVGRALQGTVPGLTLTYATGKLNQDPIIKVRGYGSVNGDSDPLVLIDGVQGNLTDIDPESIESVSVLKDAAASSIYGARAAFGVILVTTKKGSEGEPRISYSNNFAVNRPIWNIKHAPMADLMDAIHTAKARNNGGAPFAFGMGGEDWRQKSIAWEEQYGYLGSGLDDDTMVEIRDFEVIDGQFYSYRSWDVFDQILADNSNSSTHNINVNGGTQKLKYSISYMLSNREGLYKENTETQRRNNLNAYVSSSLLNDRLVIGVRSMYTKKEYEEPFSYRSGGSLGELFYALRWPSNFPYGISDGTYFGAPEGTSFIGPIGFLRNANRNTIDETFNRQMVDATVKILKGDNQTLNIAANYSVSNTSKNEHRKGGSLPMINWWSTGSPPAYNPTLYAGNTAWDFTRYLITETQLNAFNAYATYTNSQLKDHNFTLVGGTNLEEYHRFYITAERSFLLNPDFPEIPQATADPQADGSKRSWAVSGFFGRLNYNYKEKLLLEVNGRLDGSSQFPVGDKTAFFPSGSIGYRLSEEPIFQEALNTAKISNLKVRASWGQIGNQDVGQLKFIPTLFDFNADWITDQAGQQELSYSNPRTVSSSLTWETIETLDVGIDVGLLDNRIELNFDVYSRKNKDMLGPGQQLPSVLGASVPDANSGEMVTRGWEFTLNANHQVNKDLSFFFTGVLSDAQAEITKWSNESGILSDFYEGMKLGDIWGFETDRFFTSSDFDGDGNLNSDIPVQDPDMYSGAFNIQPGDVKYKDLNGDGFVDKGQFTKDDHGDLKVIGNTTPRYEYSIRTGANYKGFDLSVFFQGVGRRQYWAQGNVALASYHYDVLYDYQTDYWREDNTDAFYPRPFASNEGSYIPHTRNIGRLTYRGQMLMWGTNNYVPQSKYLQDLSYLRFKELTIGYTIPRELVAKAKLNMVRVYFSGYNLWEWTNSFAPIDPESTNNSRSNLAFYGTQLPQMRSYSLGLQIKL